MIEQTALAAAYFGTIAVSKRFCLDFLVFDRPVEVRKGNYDTLSDGRIVAYVLNEREGQLKANLDEFRLLTVTIVTTPPHQIRRAVDMETHELVLEEVATRHCSHCSLPTRYTITWLESDKKNQSSGICLVHLNDELATATGGWEVIEFPTELRFTGPKQSRGQVCWDEKSNTFVKTSHDLLYRKQTYMSHGELIATYYRNLKILVVHNFEFYLQAKSQLRGGWKTQTITIEAPPESYPHWEHKIEKVRIIRYEPFKP